MEIIYALIAAVIVGVIVVKVISKDQDQRYLTNGMRPFFCFLDVFQA